MDVVVTQTGYGGTTVPLNVEDNGRLVGTQQVTLPADGESSTVRVTFTANDAGPRVFRFSIPAQNAEQVTQNNTRDALIEVADRRERVLYYQGEPNSEMAFIRRAIADDKNIDLDVLQRLAEDKYKRFLVEGYGNMEEELVGGFPKTREELFAYRAVILGSVEAASFTPDQLKMLADFVSKRGGTLMMLGGRRSFAEGAWAGTPVAEVLPVEIEAGAPPKGYIAKNLAVHPTREGETFPAVQLADTDKASIAKWDEMPTVTAVNQITPREARRNGAPLGFEQPAAERRGPRVPALRPRQIRRVSHRRFVGVEDGREDVRRGHDPRHVLASYGPLACGRRTGTG